VDPSGEWWIGDTWYIDDDNNILFRTNDGSNDIVRVSKNKISDFKRYAEMYKKSEGMRDYFDSGSWNGFWKSEFGLADRQLSSKQIAHLGTLNSDWSRENCVQYWLTSSFADGMAFVLSEVASQWTNPMLVVSGLTLMLPQLCRKHSWTNLEFKP
jgi:hypothetical protein